MKYKFLPDIATGDIAFEAYGKNLSELFKNITEAVCASMANPKRVGCSEVRGFKLEAEKLEDLVYDYISEIVYLKDSEMLLFSKAEIRIEKEKKRQRVVATLFGEKIEPKKHELKEDVKSVTYHMLNVERSQKGWKATIILDI